MIAVILVYWATELGAYLKKLEKIYEQFYWPIFFIAVSPLKMKNYHLKKAIFFMK